jgi:hypothetical protein
MFRDETLAVTAAAGDAYRPADGDPMTPVLQLEGVVKKYRRGDEQVHVLT